MNEKMQKIGEMFKAKREEMNLSLKEIENATSIRTTYLQAIEEGRITKFLSYVYAFGFVRQYASFLGFDGEKLVKDNPDVFRLAPEKQEFAYGIGTLDMRSSPHKGGKIVPNLIWIGLTIIILIIAWYFTRFLGIF